MLKYMRFWLLWAWFILYCKGFGFCLDTGSGLKKRNKSPDLQNCAELRSLLQILCATLLPDMGYTNKNACDINCRVAASRSVATSF